MKNDELLNSATELTSYCDLLQLGINYLENVDYQIKHGDEWHGAYLIKSGQLTNLIDNLQYICDHVQNISNEICPDEVEI
ncbi:hypothetical protein DS832_04750 [Bombilactobacillus bombi]|uniref:Uncharacterized protein n=1 Tax=Bombilactobacillus bombi TaxID=1303590 RepID=A0A417Z829_9LACO|nr:hypothetical protein [Bombilactobacillus bombi]RHW46800.1 hypothetical protein DS832_04750 [Bombilactobacillus bombi]